MGAPNFGKIGESAPKQALIVGSLAAAVRMVGTVANGGGSPLEMQRGTILVRQTSGKFESFVDSGLGTIVSAFPLVGRP